MRLKALCAPALLLTLLTVRPSQAPAAARTTLSACRDLAFRDTGQGVHPTPVSCGREFPTSIPYVVLWMQIDDVDVPTTFAWQLVEPGDEVYDKGQFRIDPPSDVHISWSYYSYEILPVTATAKDLVEKNPRFRFSVIEVGIKPISEMPGQWKIRTTLNGRASGTLTFTLRP
ncbi:MAG TPA: hypothetical protein VIV15_10695 [Anaerolineales bacterium]